MTDFTDKRYEKAHSLLSDALSAIETHIAYLEHTNTDPRKEISFNAYIKRQISSAKCWLRDWEDRVVTGEEIERG